MLLNLSYSEGKVPESLFNAFVVLIIANAFSINLFSVLSQLANVIKL